LLYHVSDMCLQLIEETCLAPLCGLKSEAIPFASALKRLQQRRREAEKCSFTMYNNYVFSEY